MSKGHNIAYIRVSSVDQNTARQLEGQKFDHVFEDKCSGKDTKRPQLEAMLKHVRAGDIVTVHSMDRLARNLSDMLKLVEELTGRGVHIRFDKESLLFTGVDDKYNNLMLQMMGAVAQFERAMISERQKEGIKIAQANGVYRGRKSALSDARAKDLRRRAKTGENKSELAREFGITRQTLYAYIANPGHGVPAEVKAA